jgi:threonine aldolase
MRQAGILAAAGLVGLERIVPCLTQDHTHAKKLAAGLAACTDLTVEDVSTNIVYFRLSPENALTDNQVITQLAGQGIRIMAIAERRFRAVLHQGIDGEDVDTAINAIKDILND